MRSLLCDLFCAILEVMYGNGGGFGFGYGGEGGKGSNPVQDNLKNSRGTLFSGTFLSRLASDPDLPHYSDPLAPKSLCG